MNPNVSGKSPLHEQLAHMYALAACYHNCQFDKAGKPYFEHVVKVKDLLKTDDLELQMIALGHDLLEDTNLSEEVIKNCFSERVYRGIKCMTKEDGETDEEYRLKVKSNIDSIRVKMADLTHNSDIRRLKGIRQKDIDRVVKYQGFYHELKQLAKDFE